MDSYQAGYIIGRLACLVVPLLLIVGLVVFVVVLLVQKNRPTAPGPYPGQQYPAPPYPGSPQQGQAYPAPQYGQAPSAPPQQGQAYPAPPPAGGGSAYPGHQPPYGP